MSAAGDEEGNWSAPPDAGLGVRLAEAPTGAGREPDPGSAVAAARRRFPPRLGVVSWSHTEQNAEEVLARLDGPPFRADNRKTQEYRLRGAGKILEWLAACPGGNWQQRWQVSGQEELPGAEGAWLQTGWRTRRGESAHAGVLSSGLSILVCADVVRPSVAWLISRRSRQLTGGMARHRDADGFAALDRVIAADRGIIAANAQPAKARIAVILAAKGGRVAEITVGDCVEFYDAHSRIRPHGGPGKRLFYLLLHRLGVFATDAPTTLRALCGPAQGQLGDTELVDRYHLRPGPIRDLIIDYLAERRPGVDYSTLTNLAHVLAGLFWADLERHTGVASLQLAPDVAAAWKERLKTKTRTVTDPATGARTTVASPRNSTAGVLSTVRAFYLDIAQWALEEPARWGPWAAPCPIKDTELNVKKDKQAVKARMDQRTRERLPVLPALTRAAHAMRDAAAERLETARHAQPGQTFTAAGETLLKPVMYRPANAKVWAEDPATGARRDLTLEESDAFWVWAAIEVLSRTGVRIEELLELTHQAINSYRLPTTGELVPLLQIAPSKTQCHVA